jgi:hypothetical protein
MYKVERVIHKVERVPRENNRLRCLIELAVDRDTRRRQVMAQPGQCVQPLDVAGRDQVSNLRSESVVWRDRGRERVKETERERESERGRKIGWDGEREGTRERDGVGWNVI